MNARMRAELEAMREQLAIDQANLLADIQAFKRKQIEDEQAASAAQEDRGQE